ncbi:MAG: flagellar hook-basal body complex protein FliE [Candidatus Petromonas sp.]|jgi:flagellar hook-basal body complex protein FliE|nr:flagellar hook-basal body complex protein FliE [Candidatus Petromonas sp.]
MKISNTYNLQNAIINNKNTTKSSIDFKDFLFDSIDKLNSYEKEANKLGLMLAAGETDNIHSVMIASQKAEISLQLAIELRNKVIDAYKEIMRIQI